MSRPSLIPPPPRGTTLLPPSSKRAVKQPTSSSRIAQLERAAFALQQQDTAEIRRLIIRAALVVVQDLKRWTRDERKSTRAGYDMCLEELERLATNVATEARRHVEGSKQRQLYEERAYLLQDSVTILRQLGTVRLG